MMMRAAVFTEPGHIALVQRPRPTPSAGEVLIEVTATGLCAGDLYIFLGKNPYVSYPRIGGHEIAGRVASVGAEVEGLSIGAAVVVEPFIGCGHCYPCLVGKPNCCANLQIIGVHREGGFADFVQAPATRVIPIPDGLEPFLASFAEPVAIAVQACRRGMVSADDTVLIVGAGPIGLALVEVAHARGARVFVTDLSPARLATAARLGAEPLAPGDRLLPEVMEITRGEGMPVVIEATGNRRAMESTVALVAPGGRIVIVGLVASGIDIALPGLDLTRKEMTILGSRASTDCFPESLTLLASGAIRYPEVGAAFDLDAAPDVFAQLAGNPEALHKAVFVSKSAA
jgi:L-gulonate 5-dehydrogenase